MELIRIESPEEAEKAATEILAMEDGLVAVDLETAALEAYESIQSAALHPTLSSIRLAQFGSDDDERAFVFDVWKTGIEPVKRIVEGRALYAHNAVFEYKHFLHAGIKPQDLRCTMIMRNVLSAQKVGLLDTVQELLGYEMDKTMQKSGWHCQELTDMQWEYAGADAYYTARIIEPLLKLISDKAGAASAYKRYASVIPLTAEMELLGMPFDGSAHANLAAEWKRRADQGHADLLTMLGDVNPASPKQMSDWAKANLKKSVIKNWPTSESTGNLKITAETMAAHVNEHAAIKTYLDWKSYQKLDSTYGKGIQKELNPATHNVHPSWRILGARTGRFSCSKPNFQNPPREGGLREMVKAPEGYSLLDADFSQIELRIAATLSNDITMLRAYEEGKDLHAITAAAVSGVPLDQVTKEQRQAAKAVNFGLLYGGGAKMLRDYARSTYGVEMTLAEAEHARETFLATYDQFHQWQNEQTNRARSTLNARTESGYIRNFAAEGRTMNDVYTVSLNTPVQGTGAEILIASMVLADQTFKAEGLDARIIAHVHDQIVCLVSNQHLDRAAEILKDSMVKGALDVVPRLPVRQLTEVMVGQEWSKEMSAHVPGGAPVEAVRETTLVPDEEIADAFREVNEMGYRVTTMPAKTKKPEGKGWGLQPATRLPEGHKNLGIIHGVSRTACIDLDDLALSKEAFDSLSIDIEALCEQAPAWHGNPNNRIKYLFRVPDGIELEHKSLKVNDRIVFELRGDTKGKQLQDVIPPSQHPDGYTYTWVRPLVPYSELPEIPEVLLRVWADFDELEAALMANLGDNKKLINNYKRMGGGGTISPRSKALIREYNKRHPVEELLARAGYLPPKFGQDKWLSPTSNGTIPGIKVFKDQEPNLVYSHHFHDALSDHHAHDAFDILRICIHEGDYEAAWQEAYDEIGEPEIEQAEVISEEEFAQGAKNDAGEPPKPTDNSMDGMEKGLTGFVKRIYDYYMAAAYRPNEAYGIAAALMAMATATENHYYIKGYGTRLNLYMILLGRSGFGKESPRNAIKNLFEAIDLKGVIAESAASGVAIKRRLSNNRTMLLMADEVGTMIASTNGKNSDMHQTNVLKELRSLYGLAGSVLEEHPYADSRNNIPRVLHPFLNFMGTSTPMELLNGISINQIENGLVNRLLMIEGKGLRDRNRDVIEGVPTDLARDLQEFTMRRSNYPEAVLVSEEADKLIRASEEYQDNLLMSDSELAGLYGRINENTMRVAAVLAVSDRPEKPVITKNHMEWATQFARAAYNLMEQRFADDFYESETERQLKKVLKAIRDYPENDWVPKWYLTRKTRMMAKHLNENLHTLEQSEQIEKREQDTNGRKALLYRLVDAA